MFKAGWWKQTISFSLFVILQYSSYLLYNLKVVIVK